MRLRWRCAATSPKRCEAESENKGWGGPESKWHRETVAAIAQNPALAEVPTDDPIVRTWHDRTLLDDERFLWRCLRTRKHPDVVFEHASGAITVVEVEPHDTILDGLGQLAGDYLVNFRVDRRAANPSVQVVIRGVLVCDSDLPDGWDDVLMAHNIQFHRV